jgi:cation diffusion facilitator family transporter
MISFLIIYAFGEMFTQGLGRLSSFSQIKMPFLAISISLVDALVLFFFGGYETKIGKQIGAQSLVAMGKENQTHLFSSTAVLAGTLSAYYQFPLLEGLITIVISGLILKIGLAAAKDSVLALMDVSPNKEIEEKIVKAIKSAPGVEEFFDLRLRKSGPFIFGETKIGIRKFVEVKRAHQIARRLEKRVKRKVPQVDSFTIHVVPFKSDFKHLIIPVKEQRGLNSLLSLHFGRSPYFLFINLRGEKIKGHYFLKNPHQKKSVRAGLAASKMIAKQKSETLITKEIGEISFHTLRDNLVDIYQTETQKVEEAIKLFNQGKLSRLKKATRKKD